MKAKPYIPNLITASRILGTLVMLFLRPLSAWFYAVYTATGLTDVLDGYIARKTNTVSEFGKKLDSVADLLFYTVMLFKILPILWEKLPAVLWVLVFITVGLRLLSYLVAAVRYHRFASLHTHLNKASNASMFVVPYLIGTVAGVPYCWLVWAMAFLSTMEELILHLTSKSYEETGKTVLQKKK